MKIILIVLLISSMFVVTCKNNNNTRNNYLRNNGESVDSILIDKDTIESVKLIYSLNIKNNSLTRDIESIYKYSCINDDKFYAITADNKLIVIDISDKSIKTNNKVNKILDSISNHQKIISLKINRDTFYILTINGIYSLHGSHANNLFTSNKIINDFYVSNKYLLLEIRGNSSLKLFNNSKVIDSLDYDFTDDFVPFTKGICCFSDFKNVSEFEINKGKILMNTFDVNIPFSDIKDPYISLSDEKYFYVFSYTNRDKIYIYDKHDGVKFVRTIKLNKNYTPDIEDIRGEEGMPNFVLMSDKSKIYVVILYKGVLSISSV